MEISQFSASAVRNTISTAFLFITGREPGIPVQTGQHRVFGSPPKALAQEQNILLSVNSSACTSMPMQASHSAMNKPPPCVRLAVIVSEKGGFV
jgi:hypothetical protein